MTTDDRVIELFCPECFDLYEAPLNGNLKWNYGMFITPCPYHWLRRNYGPSPLLCNHANEVPSKCTCASNCYCKDNTCKHRKLIETGHYDY